jgi:hypothetical protein
VVREFGATPLAAGTGCTAGAPSEVQCALPGGARHVSVFVDADDGSDGVALGPLTGLDVAEIDGGPGDDAIAGHAGPDLVDSGPGADIVAGNAGEDRIDGGSGSDNLDGGAGRDLITYASHTRPVSADLAARRGGTRGERDRLNGFEDLAGGSASDRLFGDRRSNLLFGGLGGRRDSGRGRGGDDTITLRGLAVGGAGDDVLDAERIGCGGGRDLAFRQRFRPPGPYGRACERMRRFFYVVTHPRVTRRKLVLRFACPLRACRGMVSLRDRRGRLGSARYAADDPAHGGPRALRVAVELDRKPVGRLGRFEITGRSSARDSFQLRLR